MTRLLLALACCCVALRCTHADERLDFFEERVRPLLVDHCYECHGPDEAEGKLRLDSKAGWQRGGESGPAIVPGDPSASLLIRAVNYKDKRLQMPPPDSGAKLSERQIADLTTWVRQGAVDPREGNQVTTPIDEAAKTHWAFQPVEPESVPEDVHPVDYFIDRTLQERGFVATGPADMRTLIRRASYDLTGLPPTVEQLATPRDQFPQLVKELLTSPRYGERWGRHWLDVARYSDAKDGVLMYGDARIRPFAYTYRDYVIRAFNDDKPFDEFIRQQIAADQLGLPPDSPDLAAMGLLTLGRMFDRNRHDVIDDQIDVITRGFLGLTASCARCHDHKFDPIPTADYYSLYGVFASSVEPYDRPRIAAVNEEGKAYESELKAKLDEVYSTRRSHYETTLETARDRTPDYLVTVATTEPDVAETAIYFLSLIPGQLRPQMTHRWRKLIARRAHPDDPIFAPWHDLMREPRLQVGRWKQIGVDQRIIDGLAMAQPQTPEEVARAYGDIIRNVGGRQKELKQQIASIDAEVAAGDSNAINLADIVAGGDGLGKGTRGHGIHPTTGEATTGETGIIDVPRHDELIPVPSNPFVDGVFVPKGESTTITSTGIKLTGRTPYSGATWDYFKFGPSSGFTSNSIDGIDFNASPNTMLAMHANKGITFDLQAIRDKHDFVAGRFKALLGHGGAKGESQIDFGVYLDGEPHVEVKAFKAQQAGHSIDIALDGGVRFLTIVASESSDGLSHDQVILGNPRIERELTDDERERRHLRIAALEEKKADLQRQLEGISSLQGDPLADLLLSNDSPVWFPENDIYYYLSRQQKDAFRGLVGQLDAISVKHKQAASRAMVMVDSQLLYEPVIFQRGDPTMPGNRVPRQFLKIAAGDKRTPFTRGSGRLDLANAIASPENPLTARVWVNRAWMHHFGEPLVADPSDFGLRTAEPVHRALLDYLAVEFVKNGWQTKPLHELIMSSAAYQRASQLPENEQMKQQLDQDPDNQLLWHANRRRLDLEQMRDTTLLVSGQLDETMYGRPPLITDLNNKRRAIYAFVERQNLPNVIQTFDFASADTSTARRVTTTVPQQALFAMNSPFITQAAQALAERATEGESRQRITTLHQLTFGREPTDVELKMGMSFVEAATWGQYAQVLLMTNELMFVD